VDEIIALIIDDDYKLNSLLKEYFKKNSIELLTCENPIKGLEIVERENLDIIILDVMLPYIDGIRTLREIRKTSNIPIIMLTAKGEVKDKIEGLSQGADDYLSKPFEPKELIARMKSIIRRDKRVQEKKLKSNDLVLDPLSKNSKIKDKTLNLTTTEQEILHLFMLHPGEILTRNHIKNKIKVMEGTSLDRAVDIAMSRLRKKLGDSSKFPKYLRTVWGEGYMFVGEVHTES
jgi:DNA-binding response OmpR family regulator